jgi:transcriptional regulator with XRE-family HTH domain
MHTGALIKIWRGIRGLKEEDVASQLGISQAAYSKIESGKTKVDTVRLEQFCKVLNVAPEELLPSSKNMHSMIEESGLKTSSEIKGGSLKGDISISERELYERIISSQQNTIALMQEAMHRLGGE